MKRLRLWVCRKCGRAWRRKKSETTPYITCCGERVHKARVYPKRRISKQERIDKFKESYAIKPRTNIGTVLYPSKESKRAFRACLKAKQKPTFLRRARIFMNILAKDVLIMDTPKDSKKTWCKTIYDDGHISKSRGGLMGIPDINFNEKMTYLAGQYRRNLMPGELVIELKKSLNMSELPGTLLHEILHWIDDVSNMKDRDGHDYYWHRRLKNLEGKFNLK